MKNKSDDLPGGDSPQWDNIARTNAEFTSDYYSLRVMLRRHVRFEFNWPSSVGIVILFVIFIIYKLVT